MPRPTITIPLDEPIESHKGPVKELVYRLPKMREIMSAGMPFTVHRSKDGAPFMVDDNEAIAFYAERCCVEPEYSLVEGQVGVADALRVREAIRDFFLPAEPATADSKTSPSGSSSGSAGHPNTSAT